MSKSRSKVSNPNWMDEVAVWQMSEDVDTAPDEPKEAKGFLRKRVCLMLDSLIETLNRLRARL